MEDLADRIKRFLIAVDGAVEILRGGTPVQINSRDVEAALSDALDLDDNTLLLQHDWTAEAIANELAYYDFRRLRPEILAEVEVKESIIPDGVLRLITEERVKHRGDVWVIYKNDADPFPSSPHAHNYATGHKLDLKNGDLYLGKRKVGNIGKKRLQSLRDKIQHIDLPQVET